MRDKELIMADYMTRMGCSYDEAARDLGHGEGPGFILMTESEEQAAVVKETVRRYGGDSNNPYDCDWTARELGYL